MSDLVTVDNLLIALRPLLKLEKEGKRKGVKVSNYLFDVEEELQLVTELFTQVLNLVKEISGAEAKNVYEQTQSHLMYLFQRLVGAPVDGQTAELVDKRAQLIVDIRSVR